MFFVPENATDELVNQVEIIKDTVGSTLRYSDFQLRCNFPIALAEVFLAFDIMINVIVVS